MTAPPQGQPVPRRLRLLLMVAALVLGLDVLTKVLAVKLLVPGQPVEIIGDALTWTLVWGGLLDGDRVHPGVLTLIATGVVLGIIWMGRRLVSLWWALGLGMILGGAVGNLMDRFFRSPGATARARSRFPLGRLVAGVQRRQLRGGVWRGVPAVGLSMFGIDFDTEGKQPQADDPAGDPLIRNKFVGVTAPAAAAADEAGSADE